MTLTFTELIALLAFIVQVAFVVWTIMSHNNKKK